MEQRALGTHLSAKVLVGVFHPAAGILAGDLAELAVDVLLAGDQAVVAGNAAAADPQDQDQEYDEDDERCATGVGAPVGMGHWVLGAGCGVREYALATEIFTCAAAFIRELRSEVLAGRAAARARSSAPRVAR